MIDHLSGKHNAHLLGQFKIKPDPKRREFFWVKIFTSRKALQKYVKSMCWRGQADHSTIAMCTNWIARGPNGRIKPECGEILIPIADLTPDVISHECTHAALSWAARMGFSPVSEHVEDSDGNFCASEHEENFAYALGWMVQQIVDGVTKRSLK